MTIAAIIRIRHNGRDITGRDEDRPENVPIRAWRQIMKHGFMKVGRHWYKVYLPLHFTKAAYYRYPGVYRRRSDEYFKRWFGSVDEVPLGRSKDEVLQEKIAAARADHQPLVFTGQLREFSRHLAMRAFQTRVTIRIKTPGYIAKDPQPGHPDIPAELTAVNSQEVETMTSILQKTTEASLKQYIEHRVLPDLVG